MTERPDIPLFNRILFPVFAASDYNPHLEFAAYLAARLNKNLTSLFLEDQMLFNVVELPFVHETSLTGHRRSPINTSRLSRDLQREAIKLQQTLESIGQNHPFSWSLEIKRGSPSELLTASVTPGDLVILYRRSNALIEDLDQLLTEAGRPSRKNHSLMILDKQKTNLPRSILVITLKNDLSENARNKIGALSQVLGGIDIIYLDLSVEQNRELLCQPEAIKAALLVVEQTVFETMNQALKFEILNNPSPVLILQKNGDP